MIKVPLVCLKCQHAWRGYASTQACPHCNSPRIQVQEVTEKESPPNGTEVHS